MGLINGGFEADWGEESSHRCLVLPAGGAPYEWDVGNVFTPPGWVTWYRHKPGEWDQPEVRDCHDDPRRIHSGTRGMLLFTFSRKHDAGFLQQVEVEPGTRLRLTAWAHAWSNHKDKEHPEKFPHPDDPGWSEGPGYEAGFCLTGQAPDDNWRNFVFRLGIDPTGGVDARADSVVWGRGAYIYNDYANVPAVEAVAETDLITVFLRSRTMWPFKHNDAYWDDVELVAVPAEPRRGDPREQYERAYVLMPPGAGAEWALAVVMATWDRHRYTFGGSADDAGIGNLDVRRVIAVNPDEWPGDLAAFYKEFYPGITYLPVTAATPAELAVMLQAELDGPINLSQRNPLWANVDLGETPGGETIGEQGCLLTCLTMALRQVYKRDVEPPLVNGLLADAETPYELDDHLTNWDAAVALWPELGPSIKRNFNYTRSVLEDLLTEGWIIILRIDDGAHFVYLTDASGEPLRAIDPWTGQDTGILQSRVCGIRGMWPPSQRFDPEPVLVGLHDEDGGRYMAANGMRGCCLVHEMVQRQARSLDYSHLEMAGITVLARLNWGYADGTGTFPHPQFRDEHVQALIGTITRARGVYAFHVGNEPNNRGEWPSGHALTPAYVIGIYNDVYQGVAGRARMGLTPLDPFHGPGSDNGEWWRLLLAGAVGAECLFLHTSKTQTNDVAEIRSHAKFQDPPLQWQYLNCRSMETYLEMVPGRFRSLEVFLSEANPQRRTATALGWVPSNAAWVRELMDYVREWNAKGQRVTGVVFYRYQRAGDQAGFGLEDKPAILEAVKGECIGG